MVLGVIGFIMSLIAVLAYTGVSAWQKQSARLQLESQSQNFMYVLTEKLRQAQPGTVQISNYAGEMNESMITFTQSGQGSPVSIYLKSLKGSGGAVDRQVWMFEPAGPATPVYSAQGQLLAANVVSLYFTYPNISDTSRILVNLSMQKVPFKNKPPVYYQAQEVVYVRN